MTAWRRLTAKRLRPSPAPAVGATPDPSTTRALVARLEAAGRARLGRALALRHVGAGGCTGCLREVATLASPVHDLARLGLEFVDSPRHADVLLVTGPLTRNMTEALVLAWQAMPEPKWVVAVGDCSIDGGVFRGSYAVLGGVEEALTVDLVIRGCPPTPDQILDGLRALVEANAR